MWLAALTIAINLVINKDLLLEIAYIYYLKYFFEINLFLSIENFTPNFKNIIVLKYNYYNNHTFFDSF